jgi:hypothetical protein
MPREVQSRTPEEWQTEMQRIQRIARAAGLDPLRGEAWKAAVSHTCDALQVLIGVRADESGLNAAAHALRLALEATEGKKRKT